MTHLLVVHTLGCPECKGNLTDVLPHRSMLIRGVLCISPGSCFYSVADSLDKFLTGTWNLAQQLTVVELVREIQSYITKYRTAAYTPGEGNPKRKN
jgi:hypothetical protein